MLLHPLVGGVVLFSRNYESIAQLERLVTDVKELRSPHLMIAVDHEGGRVQRFRDGFTVLPPLGPLGKLYQHKPSRARELSELSGWLMAAEVRSVGIDFSFAPVLDVDKGVSEIIGDRAFATDPAIVTELAHSYILGMHAAGMAATGKHFPGHGSVIADSHLALPVDDRSFEDICQDDLIPFQKLVGSNIEAMMIAHVLYQNCDAQLAGFSPFWMKDVLRQRLGFQGLIFSDDLEMEGASIAGNLPERADLALQAGCDVVLVCQTQEAMMQTLDGMGPVNNDSAAQSRMVAMHGRAAPNRMELHADSRWQMAVKSVLSEIVVS